MHITGFSRPSGLIVLLFQHEATEQSPKAAGIERAQNKNETGAESETELAREQMKALSLSRDLEAGLDEVTRRNTGGNNLRWDLDLFREAREAMALVSLDGRIEDVNRATVELFGRSREDLLSGNFQDLCCDDDQSREFYRLIIEHGFVKDFEASLIGPDDQSLDCLLTAMVRRGEDGRPIGYQGIIRDVTEQKQAMERLRKSEERFRLLSENAPDIIYTLGQRGEFTYVNPAWEKILGHPPEEVLGKTFRNFSSRKNARRFLEIYNHIRDRKMTVTDVEASLITRDGSVRYFVVSSSPNFDSTGALVGMVGVCKDQTARIRDAQEIKRQKAYAEELTEFAPVAIALLDKKDRIRRINREFARLFGYSLEEAAGRPINDLIVPPGLKEEGDDLTRRAADGERFEVETRRCRRDGSLVDVSILATPILIEDGQEGIYAIYRDISALKNTERALRESEAKYRTMIENLNVGIYRNTGGPRGRFLQANPAIAAMFGYDTVEDFMATAVADLYQAPEERAKFVEELSANDFVKNRELRLKRRDGAQFWASCTATVQRGEDGSMLWLDGMIEDIHERKKAEEALRDSEEKYRSILENMQEGYFETDVAGNLTFFNDSVCRILGYTRAELLGMNNREFTSTETAASMYETFNQVFQTGRPARISDYEIITRNDEIRILSLSASLRKNARGRVLGFRGLVRDVTARKKAEDELRFVAYHDQMTGLPNRKSFYLHLDDILNQGRRRSTDNMWALMFLDLDKFKNINDSLGHDVGDELLQAVAGRIKKVLRRSDRLFRLGGDEFTIILTDLSRDIDVAKVARKIRRRVARPFFIKGHEIHTAVSIGISVFPTDGWEVEVLVKNADMAMYAAKEDGDGYRFFTEEMNIQAMQRMKLESSLRSAVSDEQFVLYYQPLVGGRNEIIGMEALIRWEHPEFGLVPPVKFIPLAEETGAIVRIGEWVLKEACRQVKKWHEQGFTKLYVAVNLSARQLKEPDLVEIVERALVETGLDPSYLKLEVTESCVMDNPEEAIAKMEELKARGIGFAIDDFGTGYSSLSYLKRFPIETLKIDRSFVTDSMNNRDDQEIIKTIIAMAQNLNITTVAEGVETREQRDFLSQQGCTTMQGYLFGRPLPRDDFDHLLRAWEEGIC